MSKEELFKALAKKGIPAFATSVLGFTVGSLKDCGATDEEIRQLVDALLEAINAVQKDPKAMEAMKEFTGRATEQLKTA